MKKLEKIVADFIYLTNQFYDSSLIKVKDSDIKTIYKNIKNNLVSLFSPGEILAVSLEKNYIHVLVMLACFELGITYVPLNKKWPTARIKELLNILKPTAFLNDYNFPSAFSISHSKILNYTTINENNQLSLSEELTAYIIFTSGTTGVPKAVMISRKSFTNFINWVDRYFNNITSEDHLLSVSALTFDLSMLDIALLLTKNINFYLSNFLGNIFTLLSEIYESKISIIATVPNNFQLMLSKGVYHRADLTTLKHILIGGARFSFGLYKNFQDKMKDKNVYNLYGPTETTVYCTVKKLTFNENLDLERQNVSVGQPIDNMDIIILNNKLKIIEFNSNGKLFIGGVQVMDGYYGDKVRTDEVLISIDGKKYYNSGDLAYKNTNGELFIIGRTDDTVKTEGFRVNLSDIDSIMQRMSYIEECATIAVPDPAKENILVSYVRLGMKKEIHEIFSDLSQIMTSYQVPKKIIIKRVFPLNNSGKICKKTLLKDYQGG